MIKCQKNRILFKFLQETASGAFTNTTDWGFQIRNPVEDVKTPRWAKVFVVGKDVKHVRPGQYILIENLMWSLAFVHSGEKLWATDESKVILVSDDEPKGIL